MSKTTLTLIFVWSAVLTGTANSALGASSENIDASVRISVCGDAVADNPEECDGPDLAGQSCATLGYATGSLSCTPSCTIDTAMCGGAAGPGGGANTTSYGFMQPANARPDVYRPVLDITPAPNQSGLHINASDIGGVKNISLCSFRSGCVDFGKNFIFKDATMQADYIRAYDKAGNVTTYFTDPAAIKRKQTFMELFIIVLVIALFVGTYKALSMRKK